MHLQHLETLNILHVSDIKYRITNQLRKQWSADSYQISHNWIFNHFFGFIYRQIDQVRSSLDTFVAIRKDKTHEQIFIFLQNINEPCFLNPTSSSSLRLSITG